MYNIYLDNLHVSEKCEKVVDTSLPQRSCPQFGALPLKKLGQLDCLQDHYDDNSEEALRSLLSTEMDENSTPTSPITITQDARINVNFKNVQNVRHANACCIVCISGLFVHHAAGIVGIMLLALSAMTRLCFHLPERFEPAIRYTRYSGTRFSDVIEKSWLKCHTTATKERRICKIHTLKYLERLTQVKYQNTQNFDRRE